MAGNTVNIELKVASQGMDPAVTKSQTIKDNLMAASTAMSRTGGGTAGGTPGSQKVAGQAYAAQRGVAGNTGASARNFAAESQGLGGLVRLYATWAANIYAVGAAFNALSAAADTTNMIKGMDQLGVASGVALGSLAKKFADATGGALSFQEAAAATTKAISAGLSTQQFEQLGEVATKASRALGVNMSDAVSRLTRGITKLEPELLDELGLFTKLGQSSEEYAKRVGKSVSSLTDFEKRQAFANAVLKEGRDKFADINVEANPYDKLAASIKNLTQSGLELVNKVLGPIINLLSTSPTALAGVMAGLGLMLVKQAIPAIGQYRDSLTNAADLATKKWQKRSDDIKKIEKDQYQYIIESSETQADARLKAFEKAEDRIAKLRKTTSTDVRAQSILGKQSYTDVTKEDIKYLKDLSKQETAAGNIAAAKQYNEAANALRYWIKAEQEHLALLKQIDAQVQQNTATASKYSATGYARDQLESARRGKARSDIVSNVAADVSIGTFGEAWKNMNKSIKDEKLTGLDKGLTKIGGAAVMATTAITRVASALTGFLGWIGLVTAALTTLYSWVSTNRAEEEKLGKAIEYATEVTKTATGTFAKFANTLTTESLVAKSNAMSALGDSVSESISRFAEFDKASGLVDRAWESTKRLFGLFGGFSKQDYLAESVSKQVMSMLDNLDDPELKKSAEDKLKTLLSVDKVDFKGLSKVLKSTDIKTLEAVPGIFEEIRTKSQATVASVAALKDNFKAIGTSFTALGNTLKSNDPLSAYASNLVKNSAEMVEAFKQPAVAAAFLNDVLTDTSKLSAFSPEAIAQILAVKDQYEDLNKQAFDYKQNLKAIEEQIQTESGKIIGKSKYKIAELTGQKEKIEFEIRATEASKIALGNTLKNVALSGMDQAFNIVLKKFNSAAAQSGIALSKTAAGFLPKSENTIKLQVALENQSIEIRKQEIVAIYELVKSIDIARVTSQLEIAKKKQDEAWGREKAFMQPEIDRLEKELALYKSKNIAKDIKEGKLDKTQTTYGALEREQGFRSQLDLLIGEQQANILRGKFETEGLKLDKEIKEAQNNVNRLTRAYDEQVSNVDEYNKLSLDQKDALKRKLQIDTAIDREKIDTAQQRKDVAITQYAIANAPKSVAAAAAKDLPEAEKQLQIAKEIFATGEKITKNNGVAALRQATTTREFSRQEVLAQQIFDSTVLKNNQDLSAVESAQQMLDLQNSIGRVAEEDYKTRTNQLKSRKIELDYARQLLEIDEERRKKLATIDEEIAKAGGEKGVEPTRLLELQADRGAANQRYADQRAGIDSVTQGLRDQQAVLESLNSRMTAYSDIFKSTFESMTDAIMEFAKTGKLNFGSLITEMIAGLVKYELKLKMMEMWAAARPFVMSFLSDIFGGSNFGADAWTQGAAAVPLAKGGAFDGGIQKFASGGAFSNSIVSSPTLFKFANGTGLMGEAGPEAIMPLKRDSSGKLGVSAPAAGKPNAGNVEVVVNNYGSDKATTKETQDSRGNRKIEVMIGDMSAGEISRSGSSSQRSMQSTYGLQPQLIRR